MTEPAPRLSIRLLGPVEVVRDGAAVPLPRSRKVRALLALLALAPAGMTRTRLCDLLWDVPNDPRGELRWCLSKLRGVVDHSDRPRVVAMGSSQIGLDLADCDVDALEVERLVSGGIAAVATEHLAAATARFRGDLLEGMQVDGVKLTGWLVGQRQRWRAIHAGIVRELARRSLPRSPERFGWLESWLRLAPFDVEAHETMVDALLRSGRVRDAEAHVNAAIRAFEQEGIEWAPLRDAWKAARASSPEPAPVSLVTVETAPAEEPRTAVRSARRGSLVVMPFAEGTSGASEAAHGLTDDIITRLAKLRALFVIARGTSYALRDKGIGAPEAGRILNVEYVVSGTVRRQAQRMTVLVELAETRDSGIVWTDEIEGVVDETFSVLDSIVDRIVAAIADEIERAECRRAILKPPSSLDAWEAYHRGLWHMYRFTGDDNANAADLFRVALGLDPTFARAHSGLSFTHFQNVFLGLVPDREREIALALETAGRSVAADDRDPAAHWAMGRALWLRGDQNEAVSELERTVALSPNFALGHYTLGFVHAQSGDPAVAIHAADHSRQLSPFDPLQFGMLGCRAIAHMRLGEREEAAEYALKAAARPNAHTHILTIAATNLALANRREQARALVARIRSKVPGYTIEDLLRAFRFKADAEKILRKGAAQIGFD